MCYLFNLKDFFHKTEGKYGLESQLEIYLQFFTGWCYQKNILTYCVECRKNPENLNSN